MFKNVGDRQSVILASKLSASKFLELNKNLSNLNLKSQLALIDQVYTYIL